MTYTKTLAKGLLGASVFSLLAAGNAFALGTTAGTDVENTFTLDYDVGGVGQPTIDTSDAPGGTDTPTVFTVDRLVDLTVTATTDVSVAPGETDQTLVYTVTNTGNDTQAYDLVLIDETGEEFDTTGQVVTYYVDGNGDGMLQTDGTDGAALPYTPGTPTNDVAPDGALFVVFEGDIPASVVSGDVSEVTLIADTLESSTSTFGTPGAEVVGDVDGNDLLAVDNVLADGTGDAGATLDPLNDGNDSATGNYLVASANVSAAKAVTVHTQDGSTCATIPGAPGTDPLAIPGSCVEYVISATNALGATDTATDIVIADILPAELIFQAAEASGFTTAPTASSTPTLGDDCGVVTCTVSYTGMSLAADTTGTITIRALVK